MFEGRSLPLLNRLITDRQERPLSHYYQAADRMMVHGLIALFIAGVLAYILSLSARCRRIALITVTNVVLFELFLQLLNLFHPLFRPVQLADTYENLWLEGKDWKDGLNRLFVYQPKPGAATYGHPFRVNRWGFRGKEFRERDAEGWDTFRIMLLGDSLALGIGVAEEDRLTEVLERGLREKYPDVKFEVINLGVHGFETVQEYKILERMWPVVRPNLTIVAFSETDPNISYAYHFEYKLPVKGRTRVMLEKLLLFRILDVVWDPIVRKTIHIPTAEDERNAAYNLRSRDWGIFEQSVRGIGGYVLGETGKEPMVIALVDVADFEKQNHYWPVRKCFEEAGFVWLDPGERFHSEPVSRFEQHPNARTHVYYGTLLLDKIVQSGVISEWRKSGEPFRCGPPVSSGRSE
jgi:hypothetical protein